MTTAVVPTVTGWSGLYNAPLAIPSAGAQTGYSFPTAAQNGARPPMDSQIARIFKRNTYRGINELFLTLLGAAAGDPAAATHKQVGSPTGPEGTVPSVTAIGDFGGNREIETVTDVDRVTTAADVTWLSKFFNNKLLEAGITYPTFAGPVGGFNGNAGQVNGVNRF